MASESQANGSGHRIRIWSPRRLGGLRTDESGQIIAINNRLILIVGDACQAVQTVADEGRCGG